MIASISPGKNRNKELREHIRFAELTGNAAHFNKEEDATSSRCFFASSAAVTLLLKSIPAWFVRTWLGSRI